MLIITGLILMTSPFSMKAQEGDIVRVHQKAEKIIPENARIEKVADGFQFTEGPVWSEEGYLLFSDIPANTIFKVTPEGNVSEFKKPSGNANGLTYDRQGRLLLAQHGPRQIARLKNDGTITALAQEYNGKRLNSPNDLVVKSNGAIFFTDPPWGLPDNMDDPAKELTFQGVFKYHNGQVTLIDDQWRLPNGIAFSPDEKYLYVGTAEEERPIWVRYRVHNNGRIGEGKVFFDASSADESGSPDGMKVDQKGNLYCTGPGGLWIISPNGQHVATIKPPQLPSNCAWGGEDGKTLYMTARTGVYKIDLNIQGVQPDY